jgi:hypothetical protein
MLSDRTCISSFYLNLSVPHIIPLFSCHILTFDLYFVIKYVKVVTCKPITYKWLVATCVSVVSFFHPEEWRSSRNSPDCTFWLGIRPADLTEKTRKQLLRVPFCSSNLYQLMRLSIVEWRMRGWSWMANSTESAKNQPCVRHHLARRTEGRYTFTFRRHVPIILLQRR